MIEKPQLLEVLEVRKDYRELGLFKCACGNEFVATTYNVKSGRKKTCGCSLKNKLNGEAHTKHGKSFSYEYSAWRSMRKRCLDPNNHAYEKYKGKLCEEWGSFQQFHADMGDAPTKKHSIDRIDNNGGYNKENCRWATMRVQQRNRSNTLWVIWNGLKLRLTEYAEQNDLTYSSAYMRLHRNQLEGVERCK